VDLPHYDGSHTEFASANAFSNGTTTEDRRRSRRVFTPMPGWVSGESHDRAARGRDVSVVDLSEHGVGFRDARGSYRVGAAHWLVVNGTTRISNRVKIVSCRKNERGGFDVGAMFF
jgi:hypothetical protein